MKKISLHTILDEKFINQIKDQVKYYIEKNYGSDTANKYPAIYLGNVEISDRQIINNDEIFDIICERVSEFYGVNISDIFVNHRQETEREIRQLIQTLAIIYTQYSLKQIAGKTGRKAHGTVLNAQKAWKNLSETSAIYARQFDLVNELVRDSIEKVKSERYSLAE